MVHLAEQLLQDAGLCLDWKDVILPLVDEISNKVFIFDMLEHLIMKIYCYKY